MLAHRLRRWVNIKPTLVERPRVFLLRGIHVVMDHVQRRGGGWSLYRVLVESLWLQLASRSIHYVIPLECIRRNTTDHKIDNPHIYHMRTFFFLHNF